MDELELTAKTIYNAICDRALKMSQEEFPDLSHAKRLWLEAGIAAGVTAAIQAFSDAGAFKGQRDGHW